MKLRKLTQRMTSALLAGAMVLSLSAPALAAAGDAGASAAPYEAASAAEAVNYGITVTMDDSEAIKVTNKNCENILGSNYTSGKLSYDPKTSTLTGTGSFGALKIEAPNTVDIMLSSDTDDDVVDGDLLIDGAHNVTVTGTRDGQTSSNHYGTIINGDANITCTGNVLLENKGTGDVVGGSGGYKDLKVTGAQDVTVRGKCGSSTYTVYGSAEINCSRDVTITCESSTAVLGSLIVTKARNVTVTSNGSHSVEGSAAITCSGIVTLENKNESGRALSGQLTYTPSPAGAYEVRAGANRSAAEAAEVVRTDDEGKTYGPASHTEAYIRIVPAAAVIPDVPDTDASSGAVGAVIVGTAIGGAAAFVGYEIATDIILRNLLPAGADIPVNRGQLAWLIWGAKGAPEPENQPAFTDVSEPEMAKAAQWCVEQGILTAPGETTFRPNGWVTRVKVIQTWNTAFPKQ